MGKPQVAGVYEKILECAKKEFLEKGFEGASLRVIAQEAGTSTSTHILSKYSMNTMY